MAQLKIRILSEQTINKIAAGEVVENPASVVKELVENSIDAGATSICVEIQGGGRQLIRISDDGCGMRRDDALLCFERHATSKIQAVEDIENLMTMGFRGEAIPSIAAISKFRLLTSPRLEPTEKESEGSLIIMNGGHLISCSAAVRSPGTTIEVQSLFFNVPVRQKFQKSPSHDVQSIQKMLGFLAFGYPHIQFELVSDQKQLLNTLPLLPTLSFNELFKKRIEEVLGKDFTAPLLPIKLQKGSIEIEGFIGPADIHKPNRTGQYLLINQRAVSSPFISVAIREGYGTMLPNQRYPVFALHVRLPGSLLDVNVHPQKKEVRLRQEYELKECLIQAVQQSLRREQGESAPVAFKSSMFEEEHIPPFWGAPSLTSFPNVAPHVEKSWQYNIGLLPTPTLSKQNSPESFSFLDKPLQEEAIPRVLTTLMRHFLIAPFELNPRLFGPHHTKPTGGLAIIDQKAAYARIYFEKLRQKTSSRETQQLLIPLTLQLLTNEARIIIENLEHLNQMGFGIRELGESTFIIDAYPAFIKEDRLLTCLEQLIQNLSEKQSLTWDQDMKDKQLATAACKASFPATTRLSIEEAQGIIKQLLHCDMPAQCPLGKPTCLYYSPEEIAKWFQ